MEFAVLIVLVIVAMPIIALVVAFRASGAIQDLSWKVQELGRLVRQLQSAMTPGATQFTSTPLRPSSSASTRVSASTPALLAA